MAGQGDAGAGRLQIEGFLHLIARVIARNILKEREGPSVAQENLEGAPNTPADSSEQTEGKDGAVGPIDEPRPPPAEPGCPAEDV